MLDKALKRQIERCLSDYPETRNSDIALTIKVWEVYYPQYLIKAKNGDYGIYIKYLYELPRQDNVKRIRANFNSRGLYLPTEWKIAKQRKINEEKWRVYMGYPPRLQKTDNLF